MFFINFFKNFNNANYPVYLLNNQLQYKTYEGKLIILNTGEDISWSYNLKRALLEIQEETIFFIFDDFLIYKKVPIEDFIFMHDLFIKHEMNSLKINRSNLRTRKVNNYISEIKKGGMYRLSLCNTFIRKNILIKLLDETETAWEFEINGSERADSFENFFCSNKNIIPYINMIDKGRITPKTIPFLIDSAITDKRGLYNTKAIDSFPFLQIKNFILHKLINKYMRDFLRKLRKKR